MHPCVRNWMSAWVYSKDEVTIHFLRVFNCLWFLLGTSLLYRVLYWFSCISMYISDIERQKFIEHVALLLLHIVTLLSYAAFFDFQVGHRGGSLGCTSHLASATCCSHGRGWCHGNLRELRKRFARLLTGTRFPVINKEGGDSEELDSCISYNYTILLVGMCAFIYYIIIWNPSTSLIVYARKRPLVGVMETTIETCRKQFVKCRVLCRRLALANLQYLMWEWLLRSFRHSISIPRQSQDSR